MVQAIDLLLVDDDEVDRMAVRRALKSDSFPFKLTEVEDCATALEILQQTSFDCMLLDYRLPDGNGLELVTKIRDRGIRTPLIVLTGQGDDQVAVELLKAGASDYLAKSKVSGDRLTQVVQNTLRLHTAEMAAEIANRQREELLKQREDFISRLTHDMQTPLVAANRMLQMFQEEIFGVIPPEVNQRISVIRRSNDNLLQMVSNLVEVYSHDAGAKKLNFAVCNVYEMLQDIIQELAHLAHDKGIALYLQSQVDVDPSQYQVLGDCLELRRVFINLIGNSLKFTDDGEIQISLAIAYATSEVIITVKDTGMGIAKSDQASLFERFRSGNHKRSNTGLGLYLSRLILEAHQGSISLESELFQGSTFTIHLPQL